ncbi:hypothetical protein [Thermococcus barophilus]|nr:hypothetical protein [Thermococcus barophilus]
MREAFSSDTRDPVRTLKAAGIDITEELEELRNIIAEISGKKLKKTKKAKRRKQLTVLKSGQVQNSTEFDTSQGEELRVEAQKLLGILQGLKFANYSTEAVERAVEGLENELSALLENPKENLGLIGLYSTVVYLLREGKFEKLEKFLREL